MPSILLFAALALGASPDDPTRYAFTTSIWGTGNLGSWPAAQASGKVGLDAADEICRSRAATASLPDSSAFAAWLSDRDSDAFCLLLGLGGKRDENCGAIDALPDMGPWFRTDGRAFAGKLSEIVDDNRVFNPLLYDEFGQRLAFHFESFTATKSDGRLNDYFDPFPDCEKWSSAGADPSGAFAPLGDAPGTSEAWTDSGTAVSCNGTRRLICMQRGQGRFLGLTSNSGHRQAFITQTNVSGDLSGIDGADAVCRAAAQNAALLEPSTFKALITSAQFGGSVVDRFVNDGPWYRIDGVRFASSLQDFVVGEVEAPLNVTEWGQYIGYAVPLVGANDWGDAAGHDCANWTSAGNMLADGSLANLTFFAPSGGHNWLNIAQTTCSGAAPQSWPLKVYCLSDSDLLFRSNLELHW